MGPMETMVSGRINGMETMVSTQEIMVSGGPHISAGRLHIFPTLFLILTSSGNSMALPLTHVHVFLKESLL